MNFGELYRRSIMGPPKKKVVEEEEEEQEPLQIIRLGTAEDNFSFTLQEENLDRIVNKIPSGMKVAVISVVGAFRTGKSFLLTFLLRYLRYGVDADLSEEWMTASGDLREGNLNLANEEDDGKPGRMSFQWRAGDDRTTTGIWLWSEPFFRKLGKETVAVLLMDTQGMFDNQTSMDLTACIFGLSTLLSSYQIYNVQNRIQEDNLQHLALFSEYGRIALTGNTGTEAGGGDDVVLPDQDEKPFQTISFLVRDWTNFKDEEAEEKLQVEPLRREMEEYLKKVLEQGSYKDLVQTREQIHSCFQKIRCFLLCHPGKEVTRKSYNGDVEKIDPLFRRLLDSFAREIFSRELEPKRMQGRELTGPELRQYVVSYVEMFKSGSKFPEAKTMLEATALANNQNARHLSVKKYREEMDVYAGPAVHEYRKAMQLMQHHEACKDGALKLFDSMANVGRRSQIKEYRADVEGQITDMWTRYEEANANRNPFQNFEYYALPLIIALAAFILRWVSDASCTLEYRDYCSRVSSGMGHIYVGIFTFLAIMSANKIRLFVEYCRQVMPVLLGMDVNKLHLKTT